MNPFEEKFTAWVDGQLSGRELEAFERELEAHPEAAEEKADALRMRELLRRNPTVPRLTTPDFFNPQLVQRITAETPRSRERPAKPAFIWPFRRFAIAGGLCLAVAFALYKTMIPQPSALDRKSKYFAQVVEAWPSDPTI